ncbi:hypothetical protein [Micromonospora endolithica]|uniref:Uncharacterized protein n=1 Tax=Micromonospora endolithica TaxID=230091 RepID=A0A3A9ZS92_9ACTN|nr:hypothetical protein [Micromonospora endolithica]RKN50466.1 hypothetical protein D7223_01330 [Micromonospora endolithica]TWJ20846.1 hypothetical protein JD76_00946 [Micromonospora endolithica]
MLSAATAHALSEALIDTERTAEQAGWDNPPQLLGMFTEADTPVEIAAVPVRPKTWHASNPLHPGAYIPATAILEVLTAYFTSPLTPAWLSAWLHQDDRAPVGSAFLCENPGDSRTPGHPYSDLRAMPDAADNAIRSLSAADIDGRYYYVLRRRGSDMASANTDHDSTPLIRQTTAGACLYRLRHLTRLA